MAGVAQLAFRVANGWHVLIAGLQVDWTSNLQAISGFRVSWGVGGSCKARYAHTRLCAVTGRASLAHKLCLLRLCCAACAVTQHKVAHFPQPLLTRQVASRRDGQEADVG